MRSAIGGENSAAAAPDRSHSEERVAVDAREKPRLRTKHGAVIAEEARPMLESGHDRVVGIDDGRQNALRALAAVVAGVEADWQHAFDRGTAVIGLALNALEGEVAADHQKPATV